MNRRFLAPLPCLVATVVALSIGCADAGGGELKAGDNSVNGAPNRSENNGNDGAFVPEREEEFEFAEPAILDTRVFVPNETLNSVAVIDSRTLAIRTIPVGFKPTRVVGPTNAADDAAVYVLNEGSSTVSIVTPGRLTVKSVDVLRRANALKSSPDGRWSLAWFDAADLDPAANAGDLSAATLVTSAGAAHQLAVGFRIERVEFTSDGSAALVVSDDGVSVVRLEDVGGDALVPPVAILPPELQRFDRSDREVTLDPDGEWAVARVQTLRGVILTELATGEQWHVSLPATPTDLDWITGDEPRVLGMLPQIDHAFVATIPDGLIAAAGPLSPPGDMGTAPDVGADVGTDAGFPDGGFPDGGFTDVGFPDGGFTDVGFPDGGFADVGTNPDAGVDTGLDASPGIDLPTMPATGFHFIEIAQPGLGAAQVAPSATDALVFSTIGQERRAVILDLETFAQRGIAFEKGVRGAIADDDGKTFVVLHSREEGAIPPGASPSDPEYIARSWGISIVDVASAATRLVLTDQKPGAATLFTSQETTDRLFMIFERTRDATDVPALRDVLRLDLESFATDAFRVPSLPEGIGRIDAAGKIYVNQIHPQGRITFVDVATNRRQTVTGYQLNAGID